jgi:hypothetical protein
MDAARAVSPPRFDVRARNPDAAGDRLKAIVMSSLALAILAGMLLAASDTHAQFGGGGGWGGGMGSRRAERGGYGARNGNADDAARRPPQAAEDLVLARLDSLRSDLKLSDDQQAAWAALSDRVLRLLSDVTRTDEEGMAREMTGPQRLDRIADVARNRSTAIDDVADAGKRLYAQLNSDQRAVADTRLPMVLLPVLRPGMGGGRPESPGSRAAK